MEKKQKFELQNVKGTRDLYEEKAQKKIKLIDFLKKKFELYDFKYLETPILEYESVLTSKFSGGEEILKELFTLKDRAERKLALRYDHTVPYSRFLGMHPEIQLPYKRYTVGQVFRNGPIKKGRLREFTQADADIGGVKSIKAEVEVLTLAKNILEELELDTKIEINHRYFLESIILLSGFKKTEVETILLSLDKIEKIGEEKVKEEIEEKIKQKNKITLLFKIIEEVKKITLKEKEEEIINKIKKVIEKTEKKKDKKESKKEIAKAEKENEEYKEEIETLKKSIKELKELFSYELNLTFNPLLARGLNYYSGIIFEVFLKNSSFKSSIAAGGRYKNIITQWRNDNIEAVGISFGVDAIIESEEKIKLEEKIKVYIIPLEEKYYKESYEITKILRNENIKVNIDINDKSFKKNLNYAIKEKYNYIIIIGEEENKTKKYTIKNLETREEKKMTIKEIIEFLKKI